MENKIHLIREYLKKIKAANKEFTKKEAFKDLLNRLYINDKEIIKIIDQITLGAETPVLNIPRKDKLHRGSADTLYNKIIIEFENNLKVSYKHAKEQLAGYLLGQLKSGEGYNFTLIVSDFINWKVVSPDISCLDKMDELQEHELILNEAESASFKLTDDNAEEFYYWIDRFLFKEEKQKATLKRVEESFGFHSHVFIESFRELDKWFNEAKKFGEVQVSYEQWHKFLSIAYGSFNARDSIFLIHTYLSIFSKMLAYAVVSNKDFIADDEMKQILDGSIFHNYNISNFVENDFFHWVKDERNFRNLKKVFRLIAQEISHFDFDNVDEDILKGVYQELIDIDTRHSLGEYYTPDWLCERIVNEFDFDKNDKILDPACGSGSFLRAAIKRLKLLNPDITSEEINNAIYGIDIHPLSVQISKTTVLLALNRDFIKYKRPIHINIVLANTLLAPEGVEDLFGNEFYLSIDKKKYLLNTQILDNDIVFNEAIEYCDKLADLTLNRKPADIENIQTMLKKYFPKNHINGNIAASFYEIYKGLKCVKEKGRDSIWAFIIKNLYKPYFLMGKFDYIIGNPPWFTYSSIKNEEYQNLLNVLAEKYQVKPKKVANYPHLEIAAIFQAYCSSYFLKASGKIAFVLPRSFFNADHHDNTRSGHAKGFKLYNIWDLTGVSPLFRIPSCVLFSQKAVDNSKRSLTTAGLKGLSFNGRLTGHNSNLQSALDKLTETTAKWYFTKQGKSSAFSQKKQIKQKGINPYKKIFKQGATIVPRAFYFVELTQDAPPDFNDRIINIKTSESVDRNAKKPWKDLNFTGRVESKFLFRTALSKSILPFALYKPSLICLPIIIDKDENSNKKILLQNSDGLIRENALHATKWFRNAGNIWDIQKTEKNKKINSIDYLNWRNKLIQQNLDAKYLVLYNASAKDANAFVLKRKDIDLEFIVESVTYVLYSNNLQEAYYLSSILNSNLLNLKIKDYQAKGLFGPRHVHKKILDIYFPKFNKNDVSQIALSELGKISHKKAMLYLDKNPPQSELTPLHLGRLRLSIRKHIKNEFDEIDKIVKRII